MVEMRSVVNTSSRHFRVLFHGIKYISITPLMIFLTVMCLEKRLLTSG